MATPPRQPAGAGAARGGALAQVNEVTDVLIKRGCKRAAIVGMATGSSTVFQGVVTLAVDSAPPAAVVAAVLILVGVAVTAASAVGYRWYTRYRARQVEAVMTRARRMARGEGAAPALLDLGAGGELLRVMAPHDHASLPAPLTPSDALPNGGMHDSMEGGERRCSLDESGKGVATIVPVRPAVITNSRKTGSLDNLLDTANMPTLEVSPGMVVVPVYLEEWSSTVEVYMPDEREAPPWLYSDMLVMLWAAVLLASVGQTLLGVAFIVLGMAFDTRPSLTVDLLCSIFGAVGGLCLLGSCVAGQRCYRVYHRYLHENIASPFQHEPAASPKRTALWQLL